MTPWPTEIEFKAEVDAATLEAIRRLALLREKADGPAVVRVLKSLYFDSRDRRLARAGISLRLRRARGRWTQTIKLARHAEGALHRVQEIDDDALGPAPALAAISDPELRASVARALNGAALELVCEIDVRRTSRRLRARDGVVDLAIDKGVIRASGAQAPIHEVEIEVLEGAPEAAYEWAGTLLGARTARLIQPSKGERGFALADGAETLARTRRTNPAAIGLAASAEASFTGLISLYARAVADNLYCTLTEDAAAGPHQLRVALRRLRTAFALYRPAIRGGVRRGLAHDARRLGRIVAPLRDADVLVSQVVAEGPEGAPQGLVDALEAWREEVRSSARAALVKASATGFAIELLRLADLGEWRGRRPRDRERLAAPVGVLAEAALHGFRARCAARGERLDLLSSTERHELRKDLRTLRYGVEIVARAEGSPQAPPFLGALRRLQKTLGQANDFAMIARLDLTLRDAAAARAFTALRARWSADQDAQSEAMIAQAAARWAVLASLEPFWAAPSPDGRGTQSPPRGSA